MTVTLNPYLNFDGNAREALEFYHSVFGGELTISTFADVPMPGYEPGPDEANKVMHGMIAGGPQDITLMAADVPPQMTFQPSTTSISLSGEDADALPGFWEQLSDGGNVDVSLAEAPWGDTFGMLTDRFGIPWMVNIVKG
ncbi:MAG TPA: VOC family protein [Aeromicrobium sp.]|nr:VOC family protein [Aeromicrobium sp.]